MAAFDDKCKVVMVGDADVGKSSIVARFMRDVFEPAYSSTIGVDFVTKTMYVGDCRVHLSIWDTAGQEKFRSIVRGYFRGCSAAVAVYDITSRPTFDGIVSWTEEVKSFGKPIGVLVGNKADLASSRETSSLREVRWDEGEALARKLGWSFFETSAKTGQCVHEVFRNIAKRFIVSQPYSIVNRTTLPSIMLSSAAMIELPTTVIVGSDASAVVANNSWRSRPISSSTFSTCC
jgi:Ras-related protein Rab-6A